MLKEINKLITKVREKGVLFAGVFWFNFYMGFIPLLAMTLLTLLRGNTAITMTLAIFIVIILLEIQRTHIFQLSLLMIILNILLWFVMGILPFVQDIFGFLPGITGYVLLAPYAFVSGGLTHLLLWKSSHDEYRTMRGAVIISVMIALVAATTDIIITLSATVAENLVKYGWLTSGVSTIVVEALGETFYNPIAGFFIVLFLFNWMIVVRYLKATRNDKHLLLYLIPIMVFFAFYTLIRV